jgi:hypothetical protein
MGDFIGTRTLQTLQCVCREKTVERAVRLLERGVDGFVGFAYYVREGSLVAASGARHKAFLLSPGCMRFFCGFVLHRLFLLLCTRRTARGF